MGTLKFDNCTEFQFFNPSSLVRTKLEIVFCFRLSTFNSSCGTLWLGQAPTAVWPPAAITVRNCFGFKTCGGLRFRVSLHKDNWGGCVLAVAPLTVAINSHSPSTKRARALPSSLRYSASLEKDNLGFVLAIGPPVVVTDPLSASTKTPAVVSVSRSF